MNNTLRNVLIISLAAVVGAGLFFAGMFFAASRFGVGMMGGYGPYGMMGYANRGYNNTPNGYYSPGMMGGGMMGGYGSGLASATRISVEDALKAVEAYLAQIDDPNLELKEIMIFDNGGYAIISEKNSGIGAFELLIDPVSLAAYPEYGPNMMWNLKYGMMSANANYGNYAGMMGGMMGRWFNNAPSASATAEMPVSAAEAAKYAQQYLDKTLPGVKVSDEITPFFGYYTIDLERDGKIIGMLSVNGYTGQVFLHTWHGAFLEMSE